MKLLKDGAEKRRGREQQHQQQEEGDGSRLSGSVEDEARLVGDDLAVDPVLIHGHSDVASRGLSLETTVGADKSSCCSLDPLVGGDILGHHRGACISLHRFNTVTVTSPEKCRLIFIELSFIRAIL